MRDQLFFNSLVVLVVLATSKAATKCHVTPTEEFRTTLRTSISYNRFCETSSKLENVLKRLFLIDIGA